MFRSILNSVLQMFKPKLRSQYEVEKAEQVFYIRYLQPGMVAFDVGANIGELSLLFSRLVGRSGTVHSFECSPVTYKRLRDMIAISNRRNIKPNRLCLSDKTGTAELHIYDDDHATWNTMADRPLHKYGIDIKPVSIEKVQTTTIDEYCEANNIRHIDLLKIDVEGAEYQVIKGASRMMREHRIKCVIFEFGQTTYDMGNDPGVLIELIRNNGYKLRNLVRGSPVFPGGESAATARFAMHVCTPRS